MIEGLSIVGDAYQFECAAVVFDDGGAVFDPIPGIAPEDAFHIGHFRLMNMTANHAMEASPAGVSGGAHTKRGEMSTDGPKWFSHPSDE
ncbi:MAG: hypothetical protein RL215_1216 [Planctomycetota bacterium]